jgi:hypothetical protein
MVNSEFRRTSKKTKTIIYLWVRGYSFRLKDVLSKPIFISCLGNSWWSAYIVKISCVKVGCSIFILSGYLYASLLLIILRNMRSNNYTSVSSFTLKTLSEYFRQRGIKSSAFCCWFHSTEQAIQRVPKSLLHIPYIAAPVVEATGEISLSLTRIWVLSRVLTAGMCGTFTEKLKTMFCFSKSFDFGCRVREGS